MFYSKLYLNKEPKIPTLLSILLIVSAIYITGRFLLTNSVPTRAQKKVVLKTEIVNIHSNQVTVNWNTSSNEEGYVLYGTNVNTLTSVANDIKDKNQKRGKYKNHTVEIKNLKDSTRYYVKIISDNKLVLDTNGNPFEFTTSKEEVLGEKTSKVIKLDLIDFIYPSFNAIVSATSPLIKGVALPNSSITISLKGVNINRNYTVSTDNKGLWSLTSITKLNPGKYTLLLSGLDKSGNRIEKLRSFTIAKSGEQVLGESTPSAITSTPEPTPTIEPTQIPTKPLVSASPTIPVSGNSAMYMWIASIMFVILGFSLILFSSI